MSIGGRTLLAVVVTLAIGLVSAAGAEAGSSHRAAAAKAAGLKGKHRKEAFAPKPKAARKSKKAKRLVVGGTVVSIRDTPWQVYVFTNGGDCGGSILDSTTVLTAAHCVDSAVANAQPEDGGVGVIAGLSNLDQLPIASTDDPQFALAKQIRVHPQWQGVASATGDIAVLKLDTPLALDGVTAQAVTLPTGPVPAGDALVGTRLQVSGYGVFNSGFPQNFDGALRSAQGGVVDPDVCDVDDNAVTVCGMNPTGSSCQGDSGGPVVVPPATAGAAPVQVGTVSTGPVGCGEGTDDHFTNLYAPEMRAFIDGNPAPPLAPRRAFGDPSLIAPFTLQVGDVVTCRPGAFTGQVTVETKLVSDDGVILASALGGPVGFTLTAGQVGRKLRCRSYATSPGGIALSYLMETVRAVAALPAPLPPGANPAPPAVAVPAKCAITREDRGESIYLYDAPLSVRRRKSHGFDFVVGRADGGSEVITVTGGTFRKGKKRSKSLSESEVLDYKPTSLEGISVKLRIPSWVKRRKTYTLRFVVTTSPVGDPSRICAREVLKWKVKVR